MFSILGTLRSAFCCIREIICNKSAQISRKRTMSEKACPCQSGKTYQQCCESYILGTSAAPTAVALMRSRYTAYTLENREYLMATWDPETVPVDLTFQGNTVAWTGLEILSQKDGQENDTRGEVEFQAHFRSGNQTSRMRENSRFKKIADRWLYIDGEVDRSPNKTVATQRKVGRNEPCPCGSGKKFKKCCG